MIKTKDDLAKLTAHQLEVLAAIARQLSRDEISQFSRIPEAAANIDAEALLQAYATVQEVLSTAPSISPTLGSLAEEWQALNPNKEEQKPEESHNNG